MLSVAILLGASKADAVIQSPIPDAESEMAGLLWIPPASENRPFDGDGNCLGNAQWDFGWDGRGRMCAARTKDWETGLKGYDLTFDYDAEGRRFKKTVDEYAGGSLVSRKTVWFVWDGWDLVYEHHVNALGKTSLERKYTWGLDLSGTRGGAGGAGGLAIIEKRVGGSGIWQASYPLFDGSGNVVGLADDTGSLVAEYWWGPFGEELDASGKQAASNPWRFATKYCDEETGLSYFGHRYHDATTGTWLSREPLGESESLNLYAYCHNDPVNKVDVYGLLEVPFYDDIRQLLFGADPIILRQEATPQQLIAQRNEALRISLLLSSDVLRTGKFESDEDARLLLSQFISSHRRTEAWNQNYGVVKPSSNLTQADITLTLGASSPYIAQVPGMRDLQSALLLPTGAGGFATKGLANWGRVGRLMATGSTYSQARVIAGVKTGLQSGKMTLPKLIQATPEFKHFAATGGVQTLPPGLKTWLGGAPGTGGFSPKFWNKPIEQGGRRVFQRDDLFEATAENLAKMRKGRPPTGFDGESVNLHHLIQREPEAIAEVAGGFHSQNTKILHGLTEPKRSFRYSPDGKTTEAEKAFRRWSYQYWQNRAAGF